MQIGKRNYKSVYVLKLKIGNIIQAKQNFLNRGSLMPNALLNFALYTLHFNLCINSSFLKF